LLLPSLVTLNEAKSLSLGRQILRSAQDDKVALRMTRLDLAAALYDSCC
jgi:hypothetical protein